MHHYLRYPRQKKTGAAFFVRAVSNERSPLLYKSRPLFPKPSCHQSPKHLSSTRNPILNHHTTRPSPTSALHSQPPTAASNVHQPSPPPLRKGPKPHRPRLHPPRCHHLRANNESGQAQRARRQVLSHPHCKPRTLIENSEPSHNASNSQSGRAYQFLRSRE